MALTQLVNGVRVELDADDEAVVRAEWDANEAAAQAEADAKAAADAEKATRKGNSLTKWKNKGFTEADLKGLAEMILDGDLESI